MHDPTIMRGSCTAQGALREAHEVKDLFEARQGHVITITHHGNHRSVTAGARRHHVIVHHAAAMVNGSGRIWRCGDSATPSWENLNGISW